jgi:hypothetical protein
MEDIEHGAAQAAAEQHDNGGDREEAAPIASKPRINAATAKPTSTKPRRSKRGTSLSRRSGMKAFTRHTPRSPIGRLMKKIHCHEK